MDTGIDLNTQTYYEVKQSGEQKEAHDILNSALEVNEKLKIIIVKGIKKDLIDYGINFDRVNTSTFGVSNNLGINVYPDGEGNMFIYSKENGIEFINSLSGIENHTFSNFARTESGYELNKGELSKNGNKIIKILGNGDINSEFIKGISYLDFYSELQDTFGLIKSIMSNKKVELDKKGIYKSIISGVSRIKEVMYFKQHGYITDEDFPKLLVRAIQELPNQSSDVRFYENAKGKRMGMEVTKQELAEYLQPTEGEPLITQEMYDQCIKLIDKRDDLIRKQVEAKESTKGSLKIEKERKTVLDKISDLLGW